MTPVFTFTAYSNTGKTTFIEKLIACLKEMGLRVGALKHDGHDFEMDKEGKDSWRFAHAGADVVVLASATKAAVMDYRPLSLPELLSRMKDVDVILVEGWHTEGQNLICIWRSDCGKPAKVKPEDCVAFVADVPVEDCPVPLFPLNDPGVLAKWIFEKVKEEKEN